MKFAFLQWLPTMHVGSQHRHGENSLLD